MSEEVKIKEVYDKAKSADEKVVKVVKPKFLTKIGTIDLSEGVDPSDVIFFRGKRNIQLSRTGDNSYEIFAEE